MFYFCIFFSIKLDLFEATRLIILLSVLLFTIFGGLRGNSIKMINLVLWFIQFIYIQLSVARIVYQKDWNKKNVTNKLVIFIGKPVQSGL